MSCWGRLHIDMLGNDGLFDSQGFECFTKGTGAHTLVGIDHKNDVFPAGEPRFKGHTEVLLHQGSGVLEVPLAPEVALMLRPDCVVAVIVTRVIGRHYADVPAIPSANQGRSPSSKASGVIAEGVEARSSLGGQYHSRPSI